MIPAEEGFLFTEVIEENIAKLGEKKTLVVFTTDDYLPYGGINVKKYLTKYHFTRSTGIPLSQYLDFCVNGAVCPDIDPKLKDLLDDPNNVLVGDNRTSGEVLKDILYTCDRYSKNTNTLVVLYLTQSTKFSYSCMRDYPILITKVSMVKSVLTEMKKSSSITIREIRKSYKEFERFSNKIPRSAFIKNMNYNLYHISTNGEIKELVPRITNKPLDGENIFISRISASPTVDECFKAIGLNSVVHEKTHSRIYYVYRLLLTSSHHVVKPTKKLVPDVNMTNEHWVLEPVKVELLGYITVKYDVELDRFTFDDSNMPE
jgi:hypothetical protein